MSWLWLIPAFLAGLVIGIWLGIASVSNSMDGY
ncbi:hypothetical protein CTS44_25681 [Comamonas thiooxydans]|nr:hypothetical protein CTS44_25681 [Comamonas thiooxydans]